MVAEKVVVYRSVDGQYHEKESDCLARNFATESLPKLMSLIDEYGNIQIADNPEKLMTAEEVCAWMMKCTPQIVALLSPLVVPVEEPRRRRSKADMALEKAAQAVIQAQKGSKTSDTAKTVVPGAVAAAVAVAQPVTEKAAVEKSNSSIEKEFENGEDTGAADDTEGLESAGKNVAVDQW